MHKLIIMIPSLEQLPDFADQWPEFLRLAEQMPGLRKEATSHIQHVVSGRLDCAMVHELFFDDYQSLLHGMASPPGHMAADVLHQITRNRATLMLADHQEDEIENIKRYKAASPDEQPE